MSASTPTRTAGLSPFVVARAQREGRLAPTAEPRAVARDAAAVFQGLVLQQAWEPDVDVEGYLRAVGVLFGAALGERKRSSAKPSRGGTRVAPARRR